MASTSESTPSLPVIFTTRTQYPLPSQKFMIPASWKRYQLSQLVNKALSLTHVVPFDFLIQGEILRGSLAEWSAEKGAGEEETLEIEYIESIMPPQRMTALPHEDWVSSVSCRVPGLFLTASYDGNIRAFDRTQNLLTTAPTHSAPITHLCVVPTPTSLDTDSHLLATASHDLTARLTQLTLDSSDPTKATATTLATLHLHTAPLSNVAANESGTHILTASWDTLLGVWDTKIPDIDETELPAAEPARKKRRREDLEHGNGVSTGKRKAPAGVLRSHTARVSAVQWVSGENSRAVSCGFDSTVRLWDVENGVCVHTVAASEKPFLALALPPQASHPHTALAAATDRTVTLVDLRMATAAATTGLSFLHTATPSCIASAGGGAPQFVSGAYDGVVRVWDLRSASKEMTSFRAWEGGKKVLGVDWATGIVGIAGEGGVELWSVGEDASTSA
ncbi:WD40 repeat-like protein [Dentipellis sp. KUC8613]|nr:WD40 repeat-like protein [Dentipellis sp. KUC8613]